MASVYNFLSEDDGLITKTVNGFLPRTALIPLKHNSQDDVEILVKAGDTVKEGQCIAKSAQTSVHASIPGKVEDIVHTSFADGTEGYAAKINLQGALTFTGKKREPSVWKDFDKETLLYIFSDKGVLNTFAQPKPLNTQIKNLSKLANDILVVRLYSEDPSRVSDIFLTDHYFDQIKTGAAITAKAMGAKGIVFAYDSNKPAPDFKYTDFKIETASVGIDAKAYPNGFMHEIAAAVKETNKNNLFSKLGNRDLYIDVQTAINVYNAVCLNQPVINCHVHVTGDCLNAAGVITVKIGTTLADLAKQAGSFKRVTGKIIINGMVTGNSLSDMNIPVSKEVKSVAFIPFSQLHNQKEENCIRCGLCTKICPAGLYPESLYRCHTNKNKADSEQMLVKQTAMLCTECSLCNTVCPSRIPLSQIIAQLKTGYDDEK